MEDLRGSYQVSKTRYGHSEPTVRWFQVIIGTLRSDNGDVHENVAEKQTSHHFKLFRDYPNSPCYKKGIFAGAEERGTFSSSDRDGRIYRLAVPVPK